MEWLQMVRGAGSVFREAIDSLDNYEKAKVMILVEAPPYLSNLDALFSDTNRIEYTDLLNPSIAGQGETWAKETRSAYKKTLSHIGSIKKGMDDGEHVLGVSRRMMGFALLVPNKFIDMVEEGRPRALVNLAHYFALGAKLSHIWWIRDTPQREILGIQRSLPSEWHGLMRLPLEAVGLEAAAVDVGFRECLHIC
jgi:hypothetical protein